MAGRPSRAPAGPPSPGPLATPPPAWARRPPPPRAGVEFAVDRPPDAPGTPPLAFPPPAFVGRRPQIAHASSERALTWHTPTPTPTPTPTHPPPSLPLPLPLPLQLPLPLPLPPPSDKAAAASPLFNLQQMMGAGERGARSPFPPALAVLTPHDFLSFADERGEGVGAASRYSPGLAFGSIGSVDLSISRSPRNGELGAPMSLSVRDATKINSLDSAEIARMRPAPSPSSPNGPRPGRRPTKKVDSILERLNSGADGVVMTPVLPAASPRSVIVSAPPFAPAHRAPPPPPPHLPHLPPPPPPPPAVVASEPQPSSSPSPSPAPAPAPLRSARREPIAPPSRTPETNPGPDDVFRDEGRTETGRKDSEAETIDDIAAMIASTDSNRLPEPEQAATTTTTRSPDTSNGASAEPPPAPPAPEAIPPTNPESPKPRAPEPGKEATSFVEVENELEKMFAGIEGAAVEEDRVDAIEENGPKRQKASKTAGKKRPARKSSDAASSGPVSSDENAPKKKRKQTKRKSASRPGLGFDLSPAVDRSKLSDKKGTRKPDRTLPKDAYDSGSNASSSKSRGPYVQIRGPRDSPLSVSVINAPAQEEDSDRPLQKIKSSKSKTSSSLDNNFKNKVKSKGLHSSTLSMKYDATTTDASWICVFCKKGPHTGPARREGDAVSAGGRAQNMGDLFGPYVISADCPDYASMMNDPRDDIFKGKFKRGSFLQNERSQKIKRIKGEMERCETEPEFPNDEMYYGMVEAGPESFEIWLHEDCAVWAPGLYLIGAKIVGLDAAVWSCCTMRCDLCNCLGATVACIKRGCQKTMHVNCARADLWSLSEDNFLVYCKDHGLP